MKSPVNLDLDININHTIHQSSHGSPKRVYLFLHGFLLDGEYMHKEFSDFFIKEDALVICPNGPFLVPVKKDEKYYPKYAWYFFDPVEKNYYINYDPAAKYLADILEKLNPQKLPVTVVGYSQGGYLAPRVANFVTEVDKVISIASVFRPKRFEVESRVDYFQINSEADLVVDSAEALAEGKIMRELGAKYKIEVLNKSGHRIDDDYKAVLKKYI